MDNIPPEVLKLLIAILLGGLIGMEREFRDKAAGFRTVIFICLGSTLFTMASIEFSPKSDPARIAAQIVTGVGFLGAGAILRDGARVVGLTTAAIIWLAAATGMLVGAGHYWLAAAGTAAVVIILWIFPAIERVFDQMREVRTYEVVCTRTDDKINSVKEMFTNSGLSVLASRKTVKENEVIMVWILRGKPKAQHLLADRLMTSPDVKGFTFQD